MKIDNMWQSLATNVKACFVQTRLAQLRAYEANVNEQQSLKIIDSMNSDTVQYMLKHYPMPKVNYSLPQQLIKRKEEVIAKRLKTGTDKDEPLLIVCVYGYSQFSKAIIESLREDKTLKVHLVTVSVMERLRAEIDGKQAIELNEVIKQVDFWILATPFDEVTDFINATEENLEIVSSEKPLFSRTELLQLKNGCYLANVCNYSSSIDLVGQLELAPDVNFAMFPDQLDTMPHINFSRRVPNKIAKALHKAIRPKLNLEKDYDPSTGEFLKQPDYLLPKYECSETASVNVLADQLFDMPCEENVVEDGDKEYITKTKGSIFAI